MTYVVGDSPHSTEIEEVFTSHALALVFNKTSVILWEATIFSSPNK